MKLMRLHKFFCAFKKSGERVNEYRRDEIFRRRDIKRKNLLLLQLKFLTCKAFSFCDFSFFFMYTKNTIFFYRARAISYVIDGHLNLPIFSLFCMLFYFS